VADHTSALYSSMDTVPQSFHTKAILSTAFYMGMSTVSQSQYYKSSICSTVSCYVFNSVNFVFSLHRLESCCPVHHRLSISICDV